MKTKIAILVIALFGTLTTFAQNGQTGLIVLQSNRVLKGDSHLWGVFTPKEGFKVFNGPNGEEIGILTREIETKEFNAYSVYFLDVATESETLIKIPQDLRIHSINAPFMSVSVEEAYLTYSERKDGFIRVISDSTNYWLSLSEIEQKHFRAINWLEFYNQWADKLLEIYSEAEICLKERPLTGSKTEKVLKGELFEIVPTMESENNWIKVKVRKYKIGVCREGHEESIEYEIEGWIKAIDSAGKPLLNFYGSC